jgi:DNA-binding CsgD family transcriptional regulator
MTGPVNRDRPSRSFANSNADLHQLWSSLLELLPQGVIVVSRSLKPVYWNQKAKQMSQVLAGEGLDETLLPFAVTEACYDLLRDNQLRPASLMMECLTKTGHLMRIRTQVLEFATGSDAPAHQMTGLLATQPVPTFIAVLIENCDEILQQEAWIQQQKYDLTDRETEIWMLLRQELTYQEIAQTLQISLNTVKTHVKNVYAKRRSCQGKEKFWC